MFCKTRKNVMKTPKLFFHLDTITGLQSKCFIPHNAPNCSYIKSHSLVFSTCEESWMKIDNMSVLGDEERGSAPAVSTQRTTQRVLYKPQCPEFLSTGRTPMSLWESIWYAYWDLVLVFFEATTFHFDIRWSTRIHFFSSFDHVSLRWVVRHRWFVTHNLLWYLACQPDLKLYSSTASPAWRLCDRSRWARSLDVWDLLLTKDSADSLREWSKESMGEKGRYC